jgi:hypothetical protein
LLIRSIVKITCEEAIVPKDPDKRPVRAYLLMLAVLFQGLSGVVGGIALMVDPSGSLMQIRLKWLQGSPFDSYLIPGIILFFVLGMFPMSVASSLLVRRPWSRFAALLVGLALVGWIAVEILLIGYYPRPPLQLIYGILGVVIVVLSLLLPPVQKEKNVPKRFLARWTGAGILMS